MAKGRPNKPTALKKLEGTYRKDRAPKKEMEPCKLDLVPAPPFHFDDIAKGVWNQKAKELHALGILTTIDLDMLGRYCAAMSLAVNAEMRIKKEGMTIKATNKAGATYIQKNPVVTIWKDALAEAQKIAGQFGFTPSSRAKISMPPAKEEDAFEKLMNKAK